MSAIAPVTLSLGPSSAQAATPGSAKFKKVLSETKGNQLDPHTELTALRDKILSGGTLEPKQLLYYQIRAHQFGLGVELLSKVGESVSATVRRFEQGQ